MKNPVWPSSCVTPAGTSNELDAQNEWEENTTHKVLNCTTVLHSVFFWLQTGYECVLTTSTFLSVCNYVVAVSGEVPGTLGLATSGLCGAQRAESSANASKRYDTCWLYYFFVLQGHQRSHQRRGSPRKGRVTHLKHWLPVPQAFGESPSDGRTKVYLLMISHSRYFSSRGPSPNADEVDRHYSYFKG